MPKVSNVNIDKDSVPFIVMSRELSTRMDNMINDGKMSIEGLKALSGEIKKTITELDNSDILFTQLMSDIVDYKITNMKQENELALLNGTVDKLNNKVKPT